MLKSKRLIKNKTKLLIIKKIMLADVRKRITKDF